MTFVATGTVIAGKYRLDAPIGRGGMGWVWRAEHLEWQAPVAIKLIDPNMLRTSLDPQRPNRPSPMLQRFFSEARAAAAIRSPHVVQILDHGADGTLGLPFIVMELLEGETLEQRLEREQKLDPAMAAHVLTHVARALVRVHEAQMVHRDLKPSNVFLVQNDEEVVAKVLDFGIAKTQPTIASETPVTATGQQMGTPFYMSPEQIRGSRDIDFRADLWAFGVIAFECLTGQRPFIGETLGDLSLKICAEPLPVPSRYAPVPAGFDAWFFRSVHRDRAFTFGSAREAAENLRGLLTSRVSLAGQEVAPHFSERHVGPETMATTTAAVSSTPFDAAALRQRPSRVLIALLALLALAAIVVFSTMNAATDRQLEGNQPESSKAAGPVTTLVEQLPVPVSSASHNVPLTGDLSQTEAAASVTELGTESVPPEAIRAKKRRDRDTQSKPDTQGLDRVEPSPAAVVDSPDDLIEDRL